MHSLGLSKERLLVLCVALALLLARFQEHLLAQATAHGKPAFDELVIVSPHWEGIRNEVERGFKTYWQREAGREMRIRWLDVGGTSDALRFIRSQFAKTPDGIGIDIFFGGGTEPYQALARERYLLPYSLPESELAQLPKSISGVELYDLEQQRWYSVMISGFGILYNKRVLGLLHLPEPTRWEDLADPKLAGWVGAADPRKSGSAHVVYETILQAYGWQRGWQILQAIAANTRSFSAASSSLPREVIVGEVAYGLLLDFYALSAIRELGPDKLGYVIPPGMAVFTGDGIGIVRGAPQLTLAQAFVRYLLLAEGQRLLYQPAGSAGGPKQHTLGRFPILPAALQEANAEPLLKAYDPFQLAGSFQYDTQKGARRWNLLNDLLGVFLIDNAALLRQARVACNEARDSSCAALAQLTVPVSEAEVEALLDAGAWDDQAQRNRIMADWSASLREQLSEAGQGESLWLQALPSLALGLLFLGLYLRAWMRPKL